MIETICAPALLYLAFALVQIILDLFKKEYDTAMLKVLLMIIFTSVLNLLCEQGMTLISWVLAFIPFILLAYVSPALQYAKHKHPTDTNTISATSTKPVMAVIQDADADAVTHAVTNIDPRSSQIITHATTKLKQASTLAAPTPAPTPASAATPAPTTASAATPAATPAPTTASAPAPAATPAPTPTTAPASTLAATPAATPVPAPSKTSHSYQAHPANGHAPPTAAQRNHAAINAGPRPEYDAGIIGHTPEPVRHKSQADHAANAAVYSEKHAYTPLDALFNIPYFIKSLFSNPDETDDAEMERLLERRRITEKSDGSGHRAQAPLPMNNNY